MLLPTFLIVGAQKSGTSTLVKTLEQHSQVQLSRPKELHYFDLRRNRGLEWYSEHFTEEPGITQWGEATPAYMYYQEAREGLTEVLPDAKLIVSLRDPVDRAYSHFWHAKRTLREHSSTFEEGLALEEERLANGSMVERSRFSYVDRGFYIDQLEDLAQRHGRDKIHVMLLDDLKERRVETLRSTFEFLDVDSDEAPDIKEVWTYRYRPPADPEDGQQEADSTYQPMREETSRALAERFEPATRRLEEWLGRDLSHWIRA